MNKIELRASLGLASVYGLRMLGMFLILPIFAAYAMQISGGESALAVGMALGSYGLTQAIFQLPFGMWSDRVGRKKVIYIGLVIFAVGSLVCAVASHISWIIVGRSLQGAGAISAAVTALLADLTREENRTKAMALVGVSIALTFAASLVLAPVFFQYIGMEGIFTLTAILALLAMIMIYKVIPTPTISRVYADAQTHKSRLLSVLSHPELLRLYGGIFILHLSLMAMFVILPGMIQMSTQLPVTAHWKVYLPIVLLSFLLMAILIVWGEKAQRLKGLFVGSICILLIAELGFAYFAHNKFFFLLALLIYFVGFNVLEATLPSLISKIAPLDSKGTAIGVYNTAQSLGIFLGAVLAGVLSTYVGSAGIFTTCALLIGVWLCFASSMQKPQAVKTFLFPIGKSWAGRGEVLTSQLEQLDGVKEVVVMMDEQVAYLKVVRSAWDEAGARDLIEGRQGNGIVK